MKFPNHQYKSKKPVWERILIGFWITLAALLGVIAVAAGIYCYHNLNYYKADLRAVQRAGFVEKQAQLPDGSIINYGEGPDHGPAVLLIHGQGVSWEDYAPVLPALSKQYHIFAVDCYGHGQSSKNPEKYSAVAIGTDLTWFVENVIHDPVVVSGHSSGGLLAAWLGANAPDWVRGVVLEDPPFFNTEAGNYEKTFAWQDFHTITHNFVNQTDAQDFSLYYLENTIWVTWFGNGREPMINYAREYRQSHPGQPLEFYFLPPSITRMFLFMDDYDPRFGDAFYDASWNQGFDHASSLARITAPTIFIHASWSYNEDGILLAAIDGADAERVHQLIPNNEMIDMVSGHDVHVEKPKEFIRILLNMKNKIQ